MADTTISSIQPNVRFGTSFLDASKYRDRSANGETMMDKRTGEIVHRRKSDGSFLYFDRENIDIIKELIDIKSVMLSKVGYIYPTEENSELIYDKLLFQYSTIDAQDFIPDITEHKTDDAYYGDGGKYNNNDTSSFGIYNISNAVFVKVNVRPRDMAYINLVSDTFNTFLEGYTGENTTYLSYKQALDDETFVSGNAEITIELECFQTLDGDPTVYTISKYVRVNEMSMIDFFDYELSNFLYVRFRVVSISLPKMIFAADDAFKSNKAYQSVIDENIIISGIDESERSVSVTHIDIASFIVNQSSNFDYINSQNGNSKALALIPMREFEKIFDNIGKIGSGSGIIISDKVPNENDLQTINVWGETYRDIYKYGDIIDNPNVSVTISELEAMFGQTESIHGDISTDISDATSYTIGYRDYTGTDKYEPDSKDGDKTISIVEPVKSDKYSVKNLPVLE